MPSTSYPNDIYRIIWFHSLSGLLHTGSPQTKKYKTFPVGGSAILPTCRTLSVISEIGSMGNFEPIDIFNDICNIALTHSFAYYGKYFIPKYLRHLAFFSVQGKWFKSSIPITWNFNGDIANSCFSCLFCITVSSDSRLSFLYVHCQNSPNGCSSHPVTLSNIGSKILQRILHVFYALWLILINDCLCQPTICRIIFLSCFIVRVHPCKSLWSGNYALLDFHHRRTACSYNKPPGSIRGILLGLNACMV